MKLAATAREYVYWPARHVPADAGTPQIQLTPGGPWVDGTWSATGPLGEGLPAGCDAWVKVLAAGPQVAPEFLPHPDGTVVLPLGVTTPTIRVADAPEILPRPAGTIRVE